MFNNGPKTSGSIYIIFWIVLFGLLVFLFNRWHKINAGGIEQVQVSKEQKRILIKMSPDNTYRAKGQVNGYPVNFIVDTGANSVALPKSIADKANLNPMGYTRVHTAGGQTQGQLTRIKKLTIGPITLYNIRAIIMPENSKSVLLGMTALRKLELHQREHYLELIQNH